MKLIMLTLLRIISLKPLNHVKVILILEETLVVLDILDYLILLMPMIIAH